MKKTWMGMGLLLSAASMILMFQNCGNSGAVESTVAASCLNSSVLKLAFPQGKSYSIPPGFSTNCTNESGYDSLAFNSTNQTITLSGSSVPSAVYQLKAGGGCASSNAQGGDTWDNATGTVDTTLNDTTLRITNSAGDITCYVAR